MGNLPITVPTVKGRVVSFSKSERDICLAAGKVRDRVLGFLYLSGAPCTAPDIMTGIYSSPSRVAKALRDLMAQGDVAETLSVGGSTEFALTPQGVKAFKSLGLFDELQA